MKVVNTSIVLNFEIASYDETYEIYQILLDFIDSSDMGDVF